jgi:uncharacterized membrane protein (UPF0127 family)
VTIAGNRRSAPVYVYNKTRETFVATEAVIADGYLSRLVGLLGKTKRWARMGAGLWIVPSRGVHTIGMMFSIDLVFLNKQKEVVHVEEVVRPFRISRVSLKTDSVLELPPHTVYRTGTKVGDVLEISSAYTPRKVNGDTQQKSATLASQSVGK